MRPRASIQRLRQHGVEQVHRPPRPLELEPEVNSYFDPFNKLVDELLDEARQPFGEAIKRLEVQLAGRFDLYPRDLDAEGVRLCDEIEAADKVIIACCKHYCGLGLDHFNRFTSPSLRRRVSAATAQLKALVPALNSHTARLNAFLDSLEPRLLN